MREKVGGGQQDFAFVPTSWLFFSSHRERKKFESLSFEIFTWNKLVLASQRNKLSAITKTNGCSAFADFGGKQTRGSFLALLQSSSCWCGFESMSCQTWLFCVSCPSGPIARRHSSWYGHQLDIKLQSMWRGEFVTVHLPLWSLSYRTHASSTRSSQAASHPSSDLA